MRFPHFTIALCTLAALTLSAQQPNQSTSRSAGHWLGTLKVGVPMRLTFEISEKDGRLSGAMASIDQSASKIELSAASEKGETARFEIAPIGGVFEGKLNGDATEIVGTWSQSGAKFPLTLQRQKGSTVLGRPQEPKAPFPYREEEVTFSSKANDVRLAGTLSIPSGAGPFPTVVLISGSGLQDRDESLMGHRPFLILADHLARRGIAVLRYDDRGFGQSTGNPITGTTEDFAEDTRGAIAWLRTRQEVDPKRIGMIGHSEGGIIAPMVAAKDDGVAFIVLLAGVGVPMKDLLLRQMQDMARLEGSDEKKVARALEMGGEIFRLLTENLDDAAMAKRLRELIDQSRREMTPEDLAKAPSAETSLAMGMERIRSPWQRWAVRYDPSPTLRAVKCPVLAINGGKDCQVAAKENIDAIKRALSEGENKSVTTAILPDLNHLFQKCQTGAVKEYGEIEETMSPAALTMVSEWIRRAVRH